MPLPLPLLRLGRAQGGWGAPPNSAMGAKGLRTHAKHMNSNHKNDHFSQHPATPSKPPHVSLALKWSDAEGGQYKCVWYLMFDFRHAGNHLQLCTLYKM